MRQAFAMLSYPYEVLDVVFPHVRVEDLLCVT